MQLCENIERIARVTQIDHSIMAEDYLKRDIPVIVTDGMEDWPAREIFNVHFLNEVRKSRPVAPTESRLNSLGGWPPGLLQLPPLVPLTNSRSSLTPPSAPCAWPQQRRAAVLHIAHFSLDSRHPRVSWGAIRDWYFVFHSSSFGVCELLPTGSGLAQG